ncbi:MAG: alpha/beta hydrolase [Caulobacteraceae bacterium]|nr:alpha/beta hydrolase [Caulobacteraceae bacterium]
MADDQAPAEPVAVEHPLAALEGRKPAAPDWFQWALAQPIERTRIAVGGAGIELLAWGERGRPGLLLVHGNTAHADWWSFMAPFIAADYRVAAISLSGMGGSDWRNHYSPDVFAQEMRAGAEAAGLHDAQVAPIYVGHSFGGSQVFYTAQTHPDWMRAAIMVDTNFGVGIPPAVTEGFKDPHLRTQPNRVYPTLAEALARFRFSPPQGYPNPYIIDYIARASLKAVRKEGGGEGWTWRFDPFFWSKFDRSVAEAALTKPRARPMVHIVGADSEIPKRAEEIGGDRLPKVPRVVIPNAEHHIMADQPLALVAAIRALLAVWP